MNQKFNKNDGLPLKLSFFNTGILFELEKDNYIIKKNKHSDPLLNLFKEIEEIKNIIKSNPQDILYFLYFNLDNIQSILYKKDEIIYFDYDDKYNNYFIKINQEKLEIEKNNEIVFLFYISLLMKYNQNIVNFSFSISLINKINSINNIDINNIYKNIIISKIILELINYYRNIHILEEQNSNLEKENLNEIERNNNIIIENYIHYFEDIGFKITKNVLKLENIDFIYAKIINILLKTNNYDLSQKIIEELNLENINITKTMFNEISKILSSNDSYINVYRLTTFDDLFDSKKIDFYYILFKYILKHSIYIYYIDFLNETRKAIIKIIHFKQNQLKYLTKYDNIKVDYIIKDKVIYIIKFFTNSSYYVKYINLSDNNILNSNLKDDNEINENKQEKYQREGSMIGLNEEVSQNIDKKNKENPSNQNINNSNSIISQIKFPSFIIKEQESKLDSINYYNETLLNNEYQKGKICFDQMVEDVKYIMNDSTITLKVNNNKRISVKYEKFLYKKGEITYENFIIPYLKDKELKFYSYNKNRIFENYKKLIKFLDKITHITYTTFYSLEFPINLLITIKLKEDNCRGNDEYTINLISEYFLEKSFFMDKQYQDKNILNNDKYESFKLFSNEIINYYNISTIKNITNINEISMNNKVKEIIGELKEIKKYNIINFIKVIGKHKGAAEKIIELDNGSFVSDGYNQIIRYNMDFRQIIKYKLKNYYSFFINNNKVFISQKNKLFVLKEHLDKHLETKAIFSCRNLFHANYHYIICDENGIYIGLDDEFNFFNSSHLFELSRKAYRGGIKTTDHILAISSNRILSKGENKLIFYHFIIKLFLRDIKVENYSFTLSLNNCAVISIPKQENIKLLLWACKKYIKDDKNGILLLKLQIDKIDIKKFEKFYDTKNFEVYCFCPIFQKEHKFIFESNDKAQINDSEYFFVGGFDLDKRKGIIKLYKVIYDDEIEKIEIEFIQDIIVEKKKGKKKSECFQGFKGPISCIFQSSMGEILVTCYDGKVYLFSEPDIKSLNEENYNILK